MSMTTAATFGGQRRRCEPGFEPRLPSQYNGGISSKRAKERIQKDSLGFLCTYQASVW